MEYDELRLSSRYILYPDADITTTAHSLIKPFPIRIEHITSDKSGSNETNNSWPAKLHDMADALAAQQQGLLTKPEVKIQHNSWCLLAIQGKFITRDHQKWMIQLASQIPMKEYCMEKYTWTSKTFDSIAWHTQYQALQPFTANDQTRILKFVHDWLPTSKCLHREGKL